MVLGIDKDDVDVYSEQVGIELQEVELDSRADDLGTVVEVKVELVLNEMKHQRKQNEEEHHRDVKGEESDQGPKLVQNDHFELEGETGKLHFLVQQLLAAVGLVLVLHLAFVRVPAAEEQIYPRQNYLHNHSRDGLVAQQIQDGAPYVVIQIQVC